MREADTTPCVVTISCAAQEHCHMFVVAQRRRVGVISREEKYSRHSDKKKQFGRCRSTRPDVHSTGPTSFPHLPLLWVIGRRKWITLLTIARLPLRYYTSYSRTIE